jgi:hypothetical protein
MNICISFEYTAIAFFLPSILAPWAWIPQESRKMRTAEVRSPWFAAHSGDSFMNRLRGERTIVAGVMNICISFEYTAIAFFLPSILAQFLAPASPSGPHGHGSPRSRVRCAPQRSDRPGSPPTARERTIVAGVMNICISFEYTAIAFFLPSILAQFLPQTAGQSRLSPHDAKDISTPDAYQAARR